MSTEIAANVKLGDMISVISIDGVTTVTGTVNAIYFDTKWYSFSLSKNRWSARYQPQGTLKLLDRPGYCQIGERDEP